MANYYTKFSVAFSLPSKAAQDYAIDLHQKIKAVQFNDPTDKKQQKTLPKDLRDEDFLFNFNFECEPDGSDTPGLWLHLDDGESCGVESAITFIQHLLQKLIPKDQQDKWWVEMEWSNDCSKPRLDAFGGGVALISAQEVKSMSTSQWAWEQKLNTKNTQ